MKSLAFIVTLIMFPNIANAQIDELHVIKVENAAGFETLQNQILNEVGAITGMSFTTSDDINSLAVSEEELATQGFRLGEYIVLCFELRQPLYIRLLDTKPNGDTEQLYPDNDGTKFLESGIFHCIGDRGPYFYADRESGLGKGIIWLHGSTKDTSGKRIDEWTVPSSRGASWASLPTISTQMLVENPDDAQEIVYEAYYRYEVKE